jgi:hypothetical protein
VPVELLGLATAQTSSIRAIGIAIGTPIAVQIYSTKTGTEVVKRVTATCVASGLSAASAAAVATSLAAGDSSTALAVSGMTGVILAQAQDAVYDANVVGFHGVWYWAIALSTLGLGLSFAYDRALIKRYMDWHVDRPVEKVQHVHEEGFIDADSKM